jgi:SagB-type dehydrogenase family enzyme
MDRPEDNKENVVMLPAPNKNSSFPLMEAFEQRRSIRKWQDTPISQEDLSNLLWAACGVTKEKYGKVKCKRSAPSACNSQEIRVYVLLPEGVFRYEEETHALACILSEDIREHVGTQKMMKVAPLGLVYVADLSRMTNPYMRSDEAKRFSAWVDTGFVSQNVYLYCTAANMGSVALMLIDRKILGKKLRLQEHEKIVMTQAVGYLVE